MLSIDFLYWVLLAVPSILVASTVHEYSHGLAAFKLGDPTAKAEGRLTLNPLAHIDPVGAICMVLFKFGWSKPVPINEYNFEKRELYTAFAALAGPVSNIILLLITALINLIFSPVGFLSALLFTFATINIALAVFNLIPIPPLDGHKIVRAFLPKNIRYYWDNLEKYSIILIVIMIFPFFSSGSIASSLIGFVITKTLSLLGF